MKHLLLLSALVMSVSAACAQDITDKRELSFAQYALAELDGSERISIGYTPINRMGQVAFSADQIKQNPKVILTEQCASKCRIGNSELRELIANLKPSGATNCSAENMFSFSIMFASRDDVGLVLSISADGHCVVGPDDREWTSEASFYPELVRRLSRPMELIRQDAEWE